MGLLFTGWKTANNGPPVPAHTYRNSTQQTRSLHLLFLRPTCLFVIYIYFIPVHKRTVRMCRPEKDPPPGGRATVAPPMLCRKSPRADLQGRAVIDEDPQSRGSRGKDQFVYAALSPGSLWQLDLCHADVRHRFLIWSRARRAQAALLLSIQCILMKRKGGGVGGDLAPDPTAGLTQRWERRAGG